MLEPLTRGAYVIELQESRVDVRARLRSAKRIEGWCDAPGIYLGHLFLVLRVAGSEPITLEVAANQTPSRDAAVSWRITSLDRRAANARLVIDRMYRACLAYGGTGTAQGTTPQSAATGGSDESGEARASRARSALRDALDVPLDTADATLRAEALLQDASAAYDESEWNGVVTGATRAATLFHAAGDTQREAAAHLQTAFGLTEMAAGDRERSSSLHVDAERRYTQAIELFTVGADPWAAAVALNARGLDRYYARNYDAAYRDYVPAADALTKLGASRDLSDTLNNLALLDVDLGRYAAAADRLKRSLALLDEERDAGPISFRMDNLGLSQLMLGRYDEALRSYSDAAVFHERVRDRRELGRSLLGLGRVYFAVGDRSTAREFLEKALALRNDGVEPRGLPATLRSLAMLALADGDYPRTLSLLKTAERTVQNASTAAFVQLQRADALDRIGARGMARASVERLVAGGGDTPAIAMAYRLQGRFHERDAKFTEAARSYAEARRRLQRLDLPAELADTETALGRLSARRAEWQAAHAHFDAAWNAAARTRQRVSNPELRAAVAAPSLLVTDARLAALRMESKGRAAKGDAAFARRSLNFAELARARVFEETLDVAGRATDARARERAALLDEYMTMQAAWQSQVDRSGANDPRATYVAADLARLRARIDAVTSGMAVSQRGGPMSRPKRGSAIRGSMLRPSPDATVIAYWLPRDGSPAYAWAVSSDGVSAYTLQSSSRLEELARRARAAASDPSAGPAAVQSALAALAATILEPLAGELVGKKRIVFVPDGALYYVPFAALPFGPERRPLVVAADVALAPAVRFAPVRPEPPIERGGMRVLAIADPVYEANDLRWAGASPRSRPNATLDRRREFPRLVTSSSEASAAARLAPQSDVLTGFDATRANFLERAGRQYDVLHIAGHATVDSDLPALTSVVLSRYDRRGAPIADRVRFNDLDGIALSADLVFLSACETALGARIEGEGVVGLASKFLGRGARHVVASLWRVGDSDAAALAARFYTAYAAGNDPITALAVAQREALRRDRRATPYSWAAFEPIVAVRPAEL